MKKIAEDKGISSQLRHFKAAVSEYGSKSILYSGSKGVCLPFALLNAYAVRTIEEQYFTPDAKLDEISKLNLGSLGYNYSNLDNNTEINPEMLVLMGGLAMPHSKVTTSDVNALIDKISPKKVVGICFSSVFQKQGWDKDIDFDLIIDSQLEPVTVYEK
ncbi:DUF2124 domain-containing protein [Methanococcus maripaludis]|uniref:DUF2124 domain-containing protein n=1 Tax=Methanococcus maripaludis TaxID=39152 RepID=A0A2L1C8L6_METMI|nr:DUF2124 domain-containing protein [Methanococcus maripaludis]AVB75718.1 hypothetical protein MMJJ_03010 [Methanococcus maripaludis]MBA2864134.1 hypothetical protein [Methanococcus maripaludis]MBB6067777.1 hypothetical protein [Methanococcus maripaludis]MBB6497060.1 hypothetical protein [Methanococcus maripaludis]